MLQKKRKLDKATAHIQKSPPLVERASMVIIALEARLPKLVDDVSHREAKDNE